MTKDLRELLDAAIVEWATEQRDVRGDIFATASDLDNIKGDPLGFAELLAGEDAYRFMQRLFRLDGERERARADAELAAFNHQQTFVSDDGYKLEWDEEKKLWTDGDLEFAEEAGWPVESTGDVLRGHFTIKETK